MAKYTFSYNLIISHEIEVEADSAQEAKELYLSLSEDDIIKDFADKHTDFSNAGVEYDCIFDENGDYAYTYF